MLNVSTGVGFLLGWIAYHFLMNRAVMMRRCCLDHFATHATCDCSDCAADRAAKGEHPDPLRQGRSRVS